MKPRGQPRLTLAELLTVPFFVAAAMACIVPAVRSNAIEQSGIASFLFLEAIIIPIAMALVAQVMLTRESGRDRLVAGLLWLSAFAGRAAILATAAVTIWDLVASVARGRGLPLDLLAFLIVLVGGLIALNEVAPILRRKLNEVRCPHCGHPIITRDQPEDPLVNRRDSVCSHCGEVIRLGPDEPPRHRDEPAGPSASR
jgi:DNA-directed RNA polymerase subunit RPC12/RpoP